MERRGTTRTEVSGSRRLGRVLLVGTTFGWATTIVLALAHANAGVLLALLALLPTVVVPCALLVDAWRAHQQLGSAAAELEQRLDGLRDSQELRDLEIQRLTLLTEELLAAAQDDRRPGADRVGAAPGRPGVQRRP